MDGLEVMKDEVLEETDALVEFNDLSEFMNDPDLDKALEAIVKIIAKPQTDPAKVVVALVRLEALAAKFQMRNAVYKTIKKDKAGTENYYRKEVYWAAVEALRNLVNALKYYVKPGMN
jgi:hypothetical protein